MGVRVYFPAEEFDHDQVEYPNGNYFTSNPREELVVTGDEGEELAVFARGHWKRAELYTAQKKESDSNESSQS